MKKSRKKIVTTYNNIVGHLQTPKPPRKSSKAWWENRLKQEYDFGKQNGIREGIEQYKKEKPKPNVREIEDILHACAQLTEAVAHIVADYTTVMRGV